MRIQHNIMAMNAYRNYTNNTSALAKNLEKLSSGYKINRAGDDAAGLAISEKMRAQITGLKAAQKNVKDGVSLVKTAEGALQEVHDMLNRMVYLADQSANGTYDDVVDRDNLQKEVDSLLEEIDRIADSSNFNGIKLLDGQWDNGTVKIKTFQDALNTQDASQGTAMTIGELKDPSSTLVDGTANTANATATFDFDGVSFDKDGTVTVTVGGQGYDVDVTAGMTASDFATKFADVFNANKLNDDGAAGEFNATVVGSAITLTSASKAAIGDADLKTALGEDITIAEKATPAVAAAGDADAPAAGGAVKTYESVITGDNGTNKLAANDTIEIDGKTYTLKDGGTGAGEINSTTATTFAAQMEEAVKLYNAETDTEYIAAYADGKLTFTAKDGVTPTAEPTVTITDDAGNISAGAVTEVKTDDGAAEEGNGKGLELQIGDTSDPYNRLKVSIADMSTEAMDLKDLKINKQGLAQTAVDKIRAAINYVSSVRGDLGATQNRLEHTQNNLSVMTENIQDAEAAIRDTDVAEEMMAYTKNNILVQSAQAMLAQANQVPQGVLQLLQ